MKRLVLFVEGEGDVGGAPVLVGRMVHELPDELQGTLFVDPDPFRVQGIHHLTGRVAGNWTRHLNSARSTRRNLGGILLLLDGDADRVEGSPFCVVDTARALAEAARTAAGGKLFSVAVVFVRQEFESLLIAGYQSLPGQRPGVALPPAIENAPRDAKGWLDDHLDGGYKPTEDQARLSGAVRFDDIRTAGLRSFARLEHALREIATAVQSGQHIVSPALPPPPGS